MIEHYAGKTTTSAYGLFSGVLGGKDHEADRWVAASAIWLHIPLVTHDAIFAKVKGLTLLTKLGL